MNYFKRISVNEADMIIASNPNTILLDIRDAGTFAISHHPKALNLTDRELRKLIKTADKSLPVIVYCYHGNSSQDIAQMFCDFGFKECYSVDGGYPAWQHQLADSFPVSEPLEKWMNERNFDADNINGRIDSQYQTALMVAAKEGLENIVHDLVEAGANPNLVDSRGNNALWYACIGGNSKCVRKLINADAEICNQNRYGFTAINYSVGLEEICQMLANSLPRAFA